MELGKYLSDNRIAPRDFAVRISVTPEAVRLYLKGKRTPRMDTIKKIHAETNGDVTVRDFYALEAAE